MTRLPWALLNDGWLRRHLQAAPAEKHEVPVRTVYNALTRQHEDLPLTEFQQLLRQGKIQETVRWSQCGDPLQRVYRLV
jgi:hypothetical protein